MDTFKGKTPQWYGRTATATQVQRLYISGKGYLHGVSCSNLSEMKTQVFIDGVGVNVSGTDGKIMTSGQSVIMNIRFKNTLEIKTDSDNLIANYTLD